ncbi:MAG: hypothetical protein EXQ69_07130 [Acidimicrobiia bacterium]|nr:hypothetical protein [Acidimicrobiia bacterium]
MLDSYIVTARTTDLVRRFVSAIRRPSSGRALSLTGPYGCGKSSVAVFVASLLANEKDERRVLAEQLLRGADRDLLADLRSSRHEIGAGTGGFLTAAVTAEREPVALTITRALETATRTAARNTSSRRAGAMLKKMAERASAISRRVTRGGQSVSREVRELVGELASQTPVLLIIDEFGKCLEYAAASSHDGDLFTLQALAECGSGAKPAPVFLLTLQHLAFDDYFSGAPDSKRTEWTKIQGRFQDVPFVDSRQEVWHLIANAFDTSRVPKARQELISRWSLAESDVASGLGLEDQFPSKKTIEAAFPLHPSVLAVLPDLCARVGQHERTLFSFLTGGEPYSVIEHMQATPLTETSQKAYVRLHHVYDYFLDSVIGGASASPVVQRWLEIDTKIREAGGLMPAELRVLKTIGVLNIVSTGGPLRASTDIITYAAVDGIDGTASVESLQATLAVLKKNSLVGFRDFADEYRIWHGTDFDVSGAVHAARRRLRNVSIASLLNKLRPLPPVIAARHSQQTGTLRIFECRFVDASSGAVRSPEIQSTFDGAVIYAIGPSGFVPHVEVVDQSKPVVVIGSGLLDSLRDAAFGLAAVSDVIENNAPDPEDHVARRELRDRLAHAAQVLDNAVETVFGSRGAATIWPGATPIELSHSLSHLVSQVCERVYSETPRIANEILNRNELSSQAAKARRQLLEAMLLHPSHPHLHIEGFGPERAMYEAMLFTTGVHRAGTDGLWDLGGPTPKDRLNPAWAILERFMGEARTRRIQLPEIYEALSGPPVGMKRGPIPVLLGVWLHVHMDDVAVYENGVYQPRITADLLERLVRTPERFGVKAFAAARGERLVLAALGEWLGANAPKNSRMRNRAVLTVVAPLLSRVRALTDYAKRTKRLSPTTILARAALLDAREPDELLFVQLPEALGLERVTGDVGDFGSRRYVDALTKSVGELESVYDGLLGDALSTLCQATGTGEADDPRTAISVRAAAVVGHVADSRLRSFLLALSDVALATNDWLVNVCMNVVGRHPSMWTDDDALRFVAEVADLGPTFRHIEAIHFAAGDRAADAIRVSLTKGIGTEEAKIIRLEHPLRAQIDALVERALAGARQLSGESAIELLVGLLTDRAFAESRFPKKQRGENAG